MSTKKQTMQEVITNNHKDGLLTSQKEHARRMKELKRLKQQQLVVSIFVGAFIVFISFSLLKAYIKNDETNMKNCIEQGYSENVCLANI